MYIFFKCWGLIISKPLRLPLFSPFPLFTHRGDPPDRPYIYLLLTVFPRFIASLLPVFAVADAYENWYDLDDEEVIAIVKSFRRDTGG